jgi:hypothetical protein
MLLSFREPAVGKTALSGGKTGFFTGSDFGEFLICGFLTAAFTVVFETAFCSTGFFTGFFVMEAFFA